MPPEPSPLDRFELHYPGDLTGRIEGQMVGPNTMGETFVIATTWYDPDADRTTAKVRFPTVDDWEAVYGGPVTWGAQKNA